MYPQVGTSGHAHAIETTAAKVASFKRCIGVLCSAGRAARGVEPERVCRGSPHGTRGYSDTHMRGREVRPCFVYFNCELATLLPISLLSAPCRVTCFFSSSKRDDMRLGEVVALTVALVVLYCEVVTFWSHTSGCMWPVLPGVADPLHAAIVSSFDRHHTGD